MMGRQETSMAIKSINIVNVMVFQQQKSNDDCKSEKIKEGDGAGDGFGLTFCDGINVLIGANGVGKTTVLKMIYTAAQCSIKQTAHGKTKKFLQLFSNNLKDSNVLKNADGKNGYCYYKVSDGIHEFVDSLSYDGTVNLDDWSGLNIQSVFIPTTEMLSHAKGFLAMNQKYNMPFDGTQVDIIVNASLPETREVPASMEKVLEKISAVIDGMVILEDDAFYVVKNDGRKVDFSLEAEGLRKLGLLWKLIRNGLLETGTILLWDEPEANLNPELYPLVVEILFTLQKNGVQIFVATHSYNFAKYLEIRREDKGQVMFHNLYKGSDGNCEVIYSQSAYRMEEIEKNHIVMADNRLLDEVYDL